MDSWVVASTSTTDNSDFMGDWVLKNYKLPFSFSDFRGTNMCIAKTKGIEPHHKSEFQPPILK